MKKRLYMALLFACMGGGIASPAAAAVSVTYNGQTAKEGTDIWSDVKWTGKKAVSNGGRYSAADEDYTGYMFAHEGDGNVALFSGTGSMQTPIYVGTETIFQVNSGDNVTLNKPAVVSPNQTTVYQVSGPGKIIKDGEGSLTMQNVNPCGQSADVAGTTMSYTGDVEVKAGELCIDGGNGSQGCAVGARDGFQLDVHDGASLKLTREGRVSIPKGNLSGARTTTMEISSKTDAGQIDTYVSNLHADLHTITNCNPEAKASITGGKIEVSQGIGEQANISNLEASVYEISYYGEVNIANSSIETNTCSWNGTGQDNAVMTLKSSQLKITTDTPLTGWLQNIHVDQDSALIASNGEPCIAMVVGGITLDMTKSEFGSIDTVRNVVTMSTDRLSGLTTMANSPGGILISLDALGGIPGIATTDDLTVQLTLNNVYFSQNYYDPSSYAYESAAGLVGYGCLGDAPVWLTAEEGGAWDEAMKQMTSYQVAASAQGGITVTFSLPAPKVPEPATGTLSLLALAGLCARRRRK